MMPLGVTPYEAGRSGSVGGALLRAGTVMRLNRFSDYGLRALLYLGIHRKRRVTTEELATAYGISKSHLQKIVRRLGAAGFVVLHRGRDGGLELDMEPERIKIGEVMRVLESETPLVECFDEERNQCIIAPSCGLKGPLARAEAAFFAELDRVTLADVLGDRRRTQLRALFDG